MNDTKVLYNDTRNLEGDWENAADHEGHLSIKGICDGDEVIVDRHSPDTPIESTSFKGDPDASPTDLDEVIDLTGVGRVRVRRVNSIGGRIEVSIT